MIGLASACKTYATEYCRTDVDIRTDLLTQSGHSQHLFATYALRLKVEPLVVGYVPCPFVLYACPIADIRSINCIHLPVSTTIFEVAYFDSTMQRQKLRGGNMIAPTSMVITPSTNYLHDRLVLAIIHCAYSHVQSQRRGRAHGWYAKEVLHMSTHIVHPFDRTMGTPPRSAITFNLPKT